MSEYTKVESEEIWRAWRRSWAVLGAESELAAPTGSPAPECRYFLNQIMCGEKATHAVKRFENKHPFYCCAGHAALFQGREEYTVTALENETSSQTPRQ